MAGSRLLNITFKPQAHIPSGVTPEGVLAELDAIEKRFGKATPAIATKAVIAEPDAYPMLRAFGPKNAEEAFEKAIRDGITYAVRAIVHVPDGPATTHVRVRFIVRDEDGDETWKPIEVIARNEKYQSRLIRELQADASAFARKLEDVLAEIASIM